MERRRWCRGKRQGERTCKTADEALCLTVASLSVMRDVDDRDESQWKLKYRLGVSVGLERKGRNSEFDTRACLSSTKVSL